MPIELFLFLGLLAILFIASRGADRDWRKRHNIEHRPGRQGIRPMSKEDERDNRELARRREKRK